MVATDDIVSLAEGIIDRTCLAWKLILSFRRSPCLLRQSATAVSIEDRFRDESAEYFVDDQQVDHQSEVTFKAKQEICDENIRRFLTSLNNGDSVQQTADYHGKIRIVMLSHENF